MTIQIIRRYSANVFLAAGNNPPYIQAIANSRLVGAFVAKLIAIMRDHHGFDVAKIHVIGHRYKQTSLEWHIDKWKAARIDE